MTTTLIAPETPDPEVPDPNVLLEAGLQAATEPVTPEQEHWYEQVTKKDKETLEKYRTQLTSLKKQECDTCKAIGKELRQRLAEARWYIYEQMGIILSQAQPLVPTGAWEDYLESVNISRAQAWRMMAVAKDPKATMKATKGSIARIKVGAGVSDPETRKAASPEAVAKALSDLIEHVEAETMTPCSLCSAISEMQRCYPEWRANSCIGGECDFYLRAQKLGEKKKEKARVKSLQENPLYDLMKELVVHKGTNIGTIRPDAWVKEHHDGFGIDRIAQEAGFHDGEYNAFTEALLKLYREERALNLKGKKRRVTKPNTKPGQLPLG